MFRILIYPSSGACNYSVELPHWSYCSWFDVCWSFGVVGLEWYPCRRLKHNSKHVEHIRSEIKYEVTSSWSFILHLEWHWNSFFSKHFGFPLSVSFHHCSILVHSCTTHVAVLQPAHGYHSNPTTPKLQHRSNQEQYNQCGNSTE